ncbi:unnamed protein product [Cuscuta europaea]|uniref:Uncharacterized protein n=1 Tax=Cuscuta europaea TaxID=41803 RepID=A0A9P0ZPI5_CUSEU|nr:unnamed protein product [Cuscuta europaea]
MHACISCGGGGGGLRSIDRASNLLKHSVVDSERSFEHSVEGGIRKGSGGVFAEEVGGDEMKAGALTVEHRIGGASLRPGTHSEVSEALRDGERVSLAARLLEEASPGGVVGVGG